MNYSDVYKCYFSIIPKDIIKLVLLHVNDISDIFIIIEFMNAIIKDFMISMWQDISSGIYTLQSRCMEHISISKLKVFTNLKYINNIIVDINYASDIELLNIKDIKRITFNILKVDKECSSIIYFETLVKLLKRQSVCDFLGRKYIITFKIIGNNYTYAYIIDGYQFEIINIHKYRGMNKYYKYKYTKWVNIISDIINENYPHFILYKLSYELGLNNVIINGSTKVNFDQFIKEMVRVNYFIMWIKSDSYDDLYSTDNIKHFLLNLKHPEINIDIFRNLKLINRQTLELILRIFLNCTDNVQNFVGLLNQFKKLNNLGEYHQVDNLSRERISLLLIILKYHLDPINYNSDTELVTLRLPLMNNCSYVGVIMEEFHYMEKIRDLMMKILSRK